MNELKVLQILNGSKYFVELLDYFTDNENIYLVNKHSSKTLRSVIAKTASPLLPEDQVRLILVKIAKCLSKLHSKFIVHRDLRMDAIKVKSKKTKLKFQIGCFDFAYCLKKN